MTIGTLHNYEPFPSSLVTPRNVHVWLPPGYDHLPARPHAVLYMHDGQNLFDPTLSFLGVDWGVSETLANLIARGTIRPTIVVGVWNTPRRTLEYFPAKPIVNETNPARKAQLLADLGENGDPVHEEDLRSDHYLLFLVTELKPFIDRTYRTRPQPEHTVVVGSSAGALISLYALCEYPDIFGGAGCLSTHWPTGDGILIDHADFHLPPPAGHRIYFDFGTEAIDQHYEPYQNRMDRVMERHGYQRDLNWVTRKFQRADHSERAWRDRLHIPLQFLLGPD